MNPDDQPYEQTIAIHATPARIFTALTSAAELTRWFPSRAESDPRPGGKLFYAWDFADAAHNGTQDSHYVEVAPGSKVSYTWALGQPNPRQTLVTFLLSPNGDETVVSLAHTGFGPGANGLQERNNHTGPWGFYMGNLKSYLETGADNRAAALGQQTS